MEKMMAEIMELQAEELQLVLQTVLRRYAELFPDWEVSTVSLPRGSGRNEYLDRMIGLLQGMKNAL